MGEPAVQVGAGAAGGAPAATAPTAGEQAPQTAGAALTSVPAGTEWAASFQNQEVKSYISQKGFKSPEALAESYKNLEAKFSARAPDERTLVLPEKADDATAMRAVWERLGAPKESKDYDIPTADGASDETFVTWARDAFYKNNLTKTQAQGVALAYNEMAKAHAASQSETRTLALKHADAKLQSEWGAQYDVNVNLAKAGARVLGIDAKTLDIMEAVQGREMLFKTLQKIGVSVGESNFVTGGGTAAAEPSAEQAQQEIQNLMRDKKFQKQWNKGDAEAIARWDKLNRLAAPGEKSIG